MNKRSPEKQLDEEKAARIAAEKRLAAVEEELALLKNKALMNEDAGQALITANSRLTQLIANLQNGILATDENRKIVIVNELFCRHFGIKTPPEKLIGSDVSDLYGQITHLFNEPEQFTERINDLIDNKNAVLNDELELRNGRIFSRDYIPLFSLNEYRGQLWKYTDVTRNKTIEATFEAQRQFYEQILNNTPANIIVYNSSFQYLYVNPTAIPDPEMRKWMIGKTLNEYCRRINLTEEETEELDKFFNLVKSTKSHQEREEKINYPDGRTVYKLRKMYPVTDENGEVEILINYGIDITERKRIEEQIKLSEKRYRDIFDFSQAWICTHDISGRLMTINPAACDLLEYSEQALLGVNIESLLPEKLQSRFSATYMSDIITHGKSDGIMKIVTRSNKHLYLLYQNYLVNEPGSDPYVIGFAQNITERIHAEEALRRSEEKYRGIIENMNLGMIEIDREERIVFANQRFCTMSGYDVEELITKKATDLFLQGASLKKTQTRLTKGRYGITNSYELSVITKDGETRWWLTSAAPLFGSNGQMKGTIAIHLDITDQKKLAEQLREAKLKADRLSRSKDIFITNMSHEIRTPLNAILGLGKLLWKESLSPKQKNYLSGVESASSGLLAIVNDMLDFSKIEAGKVTLEAIDFSLEDNIAQVINILAYKAEEKGLDLVSEMDDKIWPVLNGDPYRLNQVLMNIFSNAIKFTEKGSVSLSATLLNQTESTQTVLVSIQDTGIGIKKEYLETLFDKFTQEDETVERKFGGTGLGMAITRQLMELMGGSISLKSEKNQGTVVDLLFNFKAGRYMVSDKKAAEKPDIKKIKGSRILLVEDNALNRLLASTLLTEYGAIITEAENGEEAVALVRQQDFDIVLMDIQMPVMDGTRAAQIIRQVLKKTLPIIALTANVIKGVDAQFEVSGINDFIVKPYTEENLINPVAKWLAKDSPDTGIAPAGGRKEAAAGQETATDNGGEKIDEQGEHIIMEQLYDLGKLLSIARNDNGFILKMLQLFISESGQGLIKLNEAYESGDLKTVKYYAHRMKPSITNLGITSIKDDILALEMMEEKTPAIDGNLVLVNNVLNKVMEQLRTEFKL